MQLASYLERGPMMWMMPLHLHVNQKSVYDDDMKVSQFESYCLLVSINNGSAEKQAFLWPSKKFCPL